MTCYDYYGGRPMITPPPLSPPITAHRTHLIGVRTLRGSRLGEEERKKEMRITLLGQCVCTLTRNRFRRVGLIESPDISMRKMLR